MTGIRGIKKKEIAVKSSFDCNPCYFCASKPRIAMIIIDAQIIIFNGDWEEILLFLLLAQSAVPLSESEKSFLLK